MHDRNDNNAPVSKRPRGIDWLRIVEIADRIDTLFTWGVIFVVALFILFTILAAQPWETFYLSCQ